jgi:hypothetical protein
MIKQSPEEALAALRGGGESGIALDGGRRIVHGTPITPIRLLDTLAGGSFCVSFAAPEQLDRCIELVGEDQILVLDNGAFSHWRKGNGAIDRDKFWAWANDAQDRCAQAVAVIPDVIGGTEDENKVEMSWALREGLAKYPARTMSIWHMNESFDQLAMHLKLCNFVGMGSCQEYDVQGNRAGYLERMEKVRVAREAMDAMHGRRPWIHLMRGLGVFKDVAWADSADSTNVARNHCRLRESHGEGRARELARRIEAPIQQAALQLDRKVA